MTAFSEVYEAFFRQITDDMYLELTPQDTENCAEGLLLSAIHYFEFPRVSLEYDLNAAMGDVINPDTGEVQSRTAPAFLYDLSQEEINILAKYMIVEWIGQQLASVENTRMKYSGSDFKFSSQANHMAKLQSMKKDYERQGFHLQRLYKRRAKDKDGVYRSTISSIMEGMVDGN